MPERTIADEPIPLLLEPDGTLRLRGTRVTLESIVILFDTGATAEQIVESFPSVELADAYAVLTYCLRHRNAVDAYLANRQAEAEEVRRRIQSRFDQTGLRERLRSRLDG